MLIPLDCKFAETYGLKEAIFVSYLETTENNIYIDGRYWRRRTIDQLIRELPFWSQATLRAVIKSCIKKELVLKTKNNPYFNNSVCSYAVK